MHSGCIYVQYDRPLHLFTCFDVCGAWTCLWCMDVSVSSSRPDCRQTMRNYVEVFHQSERILSICLTGRSHVLRIQELCTLCACLAGTAVGVASVSNAICHTSIVRQGKSLYLVWSIPHSHYKMSTAERARAVESFATLVYGSGQTSTVQVPTTWSDIVATRI